MQRDKFADLAAASRSAAGSDPADVLAEVGERTTTTTTTDRRNGKTPPPDCIVLESPPM
jgi:hypothetical protein